MQHFDIDNDAANYRLVGAKVVEKEDLTDSFTSVRACGNHDVMLTETCVIASVWEDFHNKLCSFVNLLTMGSHFVRFLGALLPMVREHMVPPIAGSIPDDMLAASDRFVAELRDFMQRNYDPYY